jgi:hypothetical protein
VRRRRIVGLVTVAAVLVALGAVLILRLDSETTASSKPRAAPPPASAVVPRKPRRAKPRDLASKQKPVDVRPSDRAPLRLRKVIGGDISPKSVAASGAGYVTAQNMMYSHSVTVYDANRLTRVNTIPDAVRLARLGYPEYSGVSRGAPVEAAFSADGRHGYVTNYSMYGAGFGPEGSDTCSPCSGYDRSFV